MNSSIVQVNLLEAATNPGYFASQVHPAGANSIQLLAFNKGFNSLFNSSASASKVADYPWQAFHEGGVYQRSTSAIYVASNWNGSLDNPINLTVIDYPSFQVSASVRVPGLYEANGGTTWYPPGTDYTSTPPSMIWCDEGDFDHPSALISVDAAANKSTPVVTNFLGRNFSSVNDVRQHPVTGDLWFTDADYGYFQDFRSPPTIPKQVYRFEPSTGVIQVVAADFVESNGLEFSPDLKTLYVTDTGAQEFSQNQTRPATIYAFDVSPNMKQLSNRRIFAFPDSGFPDGIHTDTLDNVWAGCGDGVHVWNSDGILLGKVYIGETSNSFAFYPGGVLIFSNYRMWNVHGLKAAGREVCKDFGVCSSGGGLYGYGSPDY